MYETMSDIPTITNTLIAMFDSNQVPSHDDNSIITVKNSTNKKERNIKTCSLFEHTLKSKYKYKSKLFVRFNTKYKSKS